MMTEPAPLELWRETVKPEWVDYNGHMNVAYYTLVFDHAVDAFFTHIGMGRDYRDATTCSTFTVEHHITYDREVLEGDGLICRTRLVGFDEKRIHHYYEMFHAEEGYRASTCEFLSLHMDMSVRRVSPLPEELLGTLAALIAEHEQLPPPDKLGRTIKIPRLGAGQP
jgi:acyl-CoA thioester hydrolase